MTIKRLKIKKKKSLQSRDQHVVLFPHKQDVFDRYSPLLYDGSIVRC